MKPLIPLTQEELKQVLIYNPLTGVFIWTQSAFKHRGKPAGTIDKNGYVIIGINKSTYKAHRLAFLYMTAYFPADQVDHIDRNKTNNKWINLVQATNQDNQRNCPIQKNNKTGISGVFTYKKGRIWQAYICVDGKLIRKYFNDYFEAACYRKSLENKYNFIDGAR